MVIISIALARKIIVYCVKNAFTLESANLRVQAEVVESVKENNAKHRRKMQV